MNGLFDVNVSCKEPAIWTDLIFRVPSGLQKNSGIAAASNQASAVPPVSFKIC
jgi:hypothetical protein